MIITYEILLQNVSARLDFSKHPAVGRLSFPLFYRTSSFNFLLIPLQTTNNKHAKCIIASVLVFRSFDLGVARPCILKVGVKI